MTNTDRVYSIKFDGLVKSRKTDFLPQHIGIMQDDDTIYCGQNKMLGLFTRPSNLNNDPKINELIDWKNKEKTLNWLDSL